jgi:hypothetical protein
MTPEETAPLAFAFKALVIIELKASYNSSLRPQTLVA